MSWSDVLDVALPIAGVVLFTTGAAIHWRQTVRRSQRTAVEGDGGSGPGRSRTTSSARNQPSWS